MGQENSSRQTDPDTSTRTLSSRSVEAIAEYIKDGRPKNIVVMTGAGISTSAGIPDFRSKDTGLYANLARLDLPYPEAVFDISYFRGKPEPFYVLAKELYPGKFFPTVAHSFVSLLDEKFMLMKLFTQNIDCLERRAGVPDDKIIEAHGSFATQRCIECKTEFPGDKMLEAVESGEVPHCFVPQCNGLVKPDIVFFGEGLPDSFFQHKHLPSMADLIIVMGTSLSVAPFSVLPQLAAEDTPRLLINKECVGDFGSRPDDVVLLDDCDSGIRKLADALGWRDELESMWSEVNGKAERDEKETLECARKEAMTKDEILEEVISELTADVEAALKLSNDHIERTMKQLEEEKNRSAVKDRIKSQPQSTSKTEFEAVPSTEIASAPLNIEWTVDEIPAKPLAMDSEAIIETTSPQNLPTGVTSASTPKENDVPYTI
ncbi:DHS-like NAD/FAD-binding domain-containing protein [Amylocarpus encephaloides]|uniref:NAD-dependent protein deacetylase n=1 Tax=Amylocarpus encephaloides TaxID=45428 RepID=A0A9P8BZG9_9HELO|nr:DHS-like NAD/FAD-binding domain-containing protein [Amylocarpus encephaloides]